jgi:hypothetical protein
MVEEQPSPAEAEPAQTMPADENPFACLTTPESAATAEPPLAESLSPRPEARQVAASTTDAVQPAAIPTAEPVAPAAAAVVPVAAAPDLQAAAPTALSASTDPERLPAGAQPKLVVLRGLKINTEYPLYEGHNFVGRADEKPVDIDLEVQEPPDRIWSSRQHAVITYEEGKLIIEDLNSSNGTFVNRNRIHPGQKRILRVNDVIQIGTVQMKVKI